MASLNEQEHKCKVCGSSTKWKLNTTGMKVHYWGGGSEPVKGYAVTCDCGYATNYSFSPEDAFREFDSIPSKTVQLPFAFVAFVVVILSAGVYGFIRLIQWLH